MTEDKQETKVHAKAVSKWAKIAIGVVCLALSVLKWAGPLASASIGEICGVCAVVMGIVTGTIDLNIVLEKFLGKESSREDK